VTQQLAQVVHLLYVGATIVFQMTAQANTDGLPTRIRMAQVLGAFSLATDLGMAQPLGHVLRACYIALRIAREMQLAPSEQAIVYYATLLMHSGCAASSGVMAQLVRADEMDATRDLTRRDYSNPLEIIAWLAQNVAPEASLPQRAQYIVQAILTAPRFRREGEIGTCEVGALMARRLAMPEGVEQTLLNLYEHWDGTGYKQLREQQIPLGARIVDPSSMLEIFHETRGRAAMLVLARAERGKVFAPDVADAFLSVAEDARFWEELTSERLQEIVLDLEPENACRWIDEARFDDVVFAFADFADAKSVATLGHAQVTAQVAEAIARRMDVPAGEVNAIRRAALLHDLGLVAIAVNIIEKQAPLTQAEQEKLRLHPYYTERILSAVPFLRPLAPIAGAHHEWMNGTGYYRGLSGDAIPLGARILGVADTFQDLTEDYRGHPARTPEDAFKALQSEVGTHFAPECYEALSQVLGVGAAQTRRRREYPAGLTAREVQVLQLVAKGFTNKQIAKQLVLSEKTVGHHVEHIYNKIGVSTRAAAVFFALGHELITP
jgi:HD-GYP domain-containing protein (c-di-GMP phosphodiesterase class II)